MGLPRGLRVAELALARRLGAALPGVDDAAWEGFDARLQQIVLTLARPCMASGLAMLLVAWTTDPLVIAPELQPRFVVWRSGAALLTGASLAALTWLPGARRRAIEVCVAYLLGLSAWLSWHVGALGDLGTPYPYYLNLLLVMTAIAPAGLGHRLVLAFGSAAAILVFCYLPNAGYREHPYLVDALILLLVHLAVGLVTGHVTWTIVARFHLQERALAQQAEGLARFSAELDARVRAQTADIRALGERLQVAQEHERTRIAYELHDELGQQLSGARFALASARAGLDAGDPGGRAALADAERMLGMASETTRRVVQALRPVMLETLGLPDACAWLVRTSCARAQLGWSFDRVGEVVEVDADRSLAVYRVLQEALTNVLRHAEAENVEVELSFGEEQLRLAIVDDGRGLPAVLGGGLGVVGMRERALANGGELLLTAAHPRGTRVELQLPLRGEA